jgi:hypothetical protein
MEISPAQLTAYTREYEKSQRSVQTYNNNQIEKKDVERIVETETRVERQQIEQSAQKYYDQNYDSYRKGDIFNTRA